VRLCPETTSIFKEHFMIKSLLIVGTGGFIGTVLRFLVSRYFQENTFSLFPWGTLTVNIVGSLLIGIFYGMSERGNMLTPEVRIFLTVGICGGFTTFSSLTNDAFILLQEKEWLKVSLYASLSFFLGLVAVYLGRTLIKSI
jgi:CrcB protein